MTKRYTRAAIDREAGGKRGKKPGAHAEDLSNALRMHYGYGFNLRDKLLEGGSRNMLRLRLACLARRDPLAAAKVVETWYGAELNGGIAGTRERYWQDDELLSSVYESWSTFGTLLTLRELEAAVANDDVWRTIAKATELLRCDLGRQQSLYALLAVPGVVRNLQGRETYHGPVVWSAGLRSIARRMGNSATTPVAAALLGGGQYVGDPGPLATAIGELALKLGFFESSMVVGALVDAKPGSPAWRSGVGEAREMLAGIRTAMHFRAAIYEDGTKVSALLGPKDASSTQEVRLVIVRGPEIEQATVVTPHAEGDERTVPPSDAWIVEDDMPGGRSWLWCREKHEEATVTELPAGEPVVQLDTYQDSPEAWSGTSFPTTPESGKEER